MRIYCLSAFIGERSLCLQDSSSRNSRAAEEIQCKEETKGKLKKSSKSQTDTVDDNVFILFQGP